MECPKCHAPMKEEETYCLKCGFTKAQAQMMNTQNTISTGAPNGAAPYSSNMNMENVNTNAFNGNTGSGNPTQIQGNNPFMQGASTTKQEIDFLDCFIDKNTEAIRNRDFSWCTFFFGPYYYIYRKMYVECFLVFVVLAFLVRLSYLLIPIRFLATIFDSFMWIGVCAVTKQLYLSHARRKIDTLRSKYPNLDDKAFATLLRRKGGTNLIGVLILFFISIAFFVFTFFAAFKITLNSIHSAEDKFANNIAYSVVDNLKLSIMENMAEQTPLPRDTKLPIKENLSYNRNAKSGYFLIHSSDGKIEIFDLEIERNNKTYICNGMQDLIECKKK